MRLLSSLYLVLYYQGRGLPQLAQNLPLLTLPQEQVHSPAGLGEPHSEQNLPVFTAPQAHFYSPAGAGLGWPHSAQNLPVLPLWPQAHVQPLAGAACCADCCAACC